MVEGRVGGQRVSATMFDFFGGMVCDTKAHSPCLHLKYSHRKHRRETEQRHHGRDYYDETGVLASACLCMPRTLGVPLVKRVVQSLLLSDEY